MSDVAGILRHDGPDGPQQAVDYEPASNNKNIFGGPNYDFSDMYKTSAQAAAAGDPTDRGKQGKKKLTKSGPTISISPISNLPLCNYGDWAVKFDRENDPAAPKLQPPPRKTFTNPSLEELRKQLKNKGANGLISLQKKFKEADDGNGHLTKEEFKRCMLSCSLMLTDSELTTLFNLFDKDKSGTVCSEEFILTLRGEMSDKRREIVYLAFQVLDSDGSGIVSLDEMAGKYDCSQHPDVITGKKSPSDVLLELIEVFEVGSTEEDKKAEISFQEFENYYSNISASIPSDKYFELMIRNAWHISGGEGEAQNSSNLRVLITRSDGKQEVVEVKNDLGLKNKTDPGYMADLERRLRAQGLRDFKIGAVGSSDSGGVKKSDKNSAQKSNFQQNAQMQSSFRTKDMGAKARIAAMAALEKLKQILVQRGSTGIIGLQRRFKIMDDDRSGQIDKEEFIKGMREYGLQLKDQEMGALYTVFDKDQSGTISIEELLVAIRGEMTEKRKILVQMAFDILDTDRSGVIDAKEIATKYDASQHPDVVSGKKTKAAVLTEFLSTFDVGGVVDGMVTFEEFENYYSNISASIDNDDYFELMMRNAWHISGGLGAAANTTNTRALVTRAGGQQEVVNLQNDLGMKKKTDKSYKDELVSRLKAQGVSDIAGVSVSGSVACSSKDRNNGRTSKQPSLPSRSLQSPRPSAVAVDSKLPGLESAKGYQLVPPPWVSLDKNDAVQGKASQTVKMVPPPWIHEEVVSLDHPVIEKIRRGTLARGIKGIVELQRQCRKVEDDESGLLNIDEFKEAVKGLKVIGDVSTAAHAALSQGADTSVRSIKVSDMELESLFKTMDIGNKGVIWTEAFMDSVRGVMPSSRQYIVDAAFQRLDERWEKVLDNHILIRNFDAANHPSVVARTKTESEIRIEFLETFDIGRTIPGKVTKAEFDNYHANLSATIEKDIDFENLMRAIWGLRSKLLEASRIMRPRERSPPPPERWNPSIPASNVHFRYGNIQNAIELDCSSIESSTDTSISSRRQELLHKMPKIFGVSDTTSKQDSDAGTNTTSKASKHYVEGLKLPTAFIEKKTTESSWMKTKAVNEGKALAADDIKALKVKAMLAFGQLRYADAEALFSEALKQASQLQAGKETENPECVQLRQSIASCKEKQQKKSK